MQIGWLLNCDMRVTVSGIQSSTMTSTEFLNSSTGLTLNVYNPASTTSTAAPSGLNVPYSTAVNSGNGGYTVVVESTSHSMVKYDTGLAVATLDHSGLDNEWRVRFAVQERGTT